MNEHIQGVTASPPGHSGSAPSPVPGLGHTASVPNAALLSLVERCENATGPDRALDVAIAVAIDWRWPDWEEGEATARGVAERNGLDWLVGRAVNGMASMWRHMPTYTASLDAAMTLVKPEWWVNVSGPMSPAAYGYSREDNRRPRAGVEMIGYPYSSGARAATHALALTAACLRALASGIEGEAGDAEERLHPEGESPVGNAETPDCQP